MPKNNELKFTDSHEWVELETNETVIVGISDYAQESLGDIVFLELPQAGRQVNSREAIAVVESVKAASDIYAPVSGEIIAVNEQIANTPEIINAAPYDSWLFKIKLRNKAELENLLGENQYLNKFS